MKILSAIWFTNSTGTAGIVITETAETKEVRAYIGVGKGADEKLDTDRIASWGTTVSAKCLVEILNLLTPPEKGGPELEKPAEDKKNEVKTDG